MTDSKPGETTALQFQDAQSFFTPFQNNALFDEKRALLSHGTFNDIPLSNSTDLSGKAESNENLDRIVVPHGHASANSQDNLSSQQSLLRLLKSGSARSAQQSQFWDVPAGNDGQGRQVLNGKLSDVCNSQNFSLNTIPGNLFSGSVGNNDQAAADENKLSNANLFGRTLGLQSQLQTVEIGQLFSGKAPGEQGGMWTKDGTDDQALNVTDSQQLSNSGTVKVIYNLISFLTGVPAVVPIQYDQSKPTDGALTARCKFCQGL